jgi:predicted porin
MGRGQRSSFRRRAVALSMIAMLAVHWQPIVAQDLTVFGVIDVGVTVTHRGGPAARWVKGVTPGNLMGSRWGVRGEEDLAEGLKAVFWIEAGFLPDIGAATPYAGDPSTATPTAPNGEVGTGFNRVSIVGLEGRYGRLTFGRFYTPVVYASAEADIFAFGLFGSLQSLNQPAGGGERWSRVSNGVFYTSPVLGGVRARVAYSLGSESDGGAGGLPKRANEFVGLGAVYAQPGLALGFSYQELRRPQVAGMPAAFTGATETRRDTMLGGKYTSGRYAVTGGYWHVDSPLEASDVWLGTSMQIGLGTLLAQAQHLRQDNPTGAEREGIVFALGYVYNLSKQTALYATAGQLTNNPTGLFVLFSGGDFFVVPGAPGADPKGLAMGMRVIF